MRILVTGKSGQLGKAMHARLKEHAEVILTGREEFDLAEIGRIEDSLDRYRPALLINAAAYTDVDDAESNRDAAFLINSEAPGAMAGWCDRHDVPMVHFSTDYVFDGSGDKGSKEDDPIGPLNVYGASKAAGEKAVLEQAGQAIVLRTSWIYSRTGRCFPNTILRLASERAELTIVDDQIGAPTPCHWLARTVGTILGLDTAQDPQLDRIPARPGIFHLTPSGHCSWYEFACETVRIAKQRGDALKVDSIKPIPTSAYPTPARRPLNSRLDTDKARKTFGIDPPDWLSLLQEVMG